MRQSEKDRLVELAKDVVANLPDRKIVITPYVIQQEMKITNPRVAEDILVRLHSRKILLRPGVGKVYYINPNQPSAVSPYSSKF